MFRRQVAANFAPEPRLPVVAATGFPFADEFRPKNQILVEQIGDALRDLKRLAGVRRAGEIIF